MNDMVSIIIPVYNGENCISIALDSLARQTYKNYEVIIIDDGSTDNTAIEVEKYSCKDSRYKYFYQNNAGVSSARNKGLEIAEGEYICFLDADDYYDYKYLEIMLCSIKLKSSEVCYCGYNMVTQKKIVKRRTRFKEGDILLDYIFEKVIVHTTGWMIKKYLLDRYNIRFIEGVSWGEDVEYFCEVLARTTQVTCAKDYLTYHKKDFSFNQLSCFNLEKLAQDYCSMVRLKNNKLINRNKDIDNALIDYRLTALLTYRLLEAIRMGENKELIAMYYKYYQKYLTKISWNNGLKSVKLNISKIMLSVAIRASL